MKVRSCLTFETIRLSLGYSQLKAAQPIVYILLGFCYSERVEEVAVHHLSINANFIKFIVRLKVYII
jgi:hypothetical protein